MFDIGFAELMIIGVVALIVIGPERLPDAIRTGSAWLNRIRRGFNDIKQEVQQELHNDEVMKDLRALRDTGDDLRRETKSLSSDLSNSLNQPEMTGDASTSADVTDPDDTVKADSKPGD
ncbi:MAG: sec-independent protein translocase protein TatB [Glaciecola sp.]|jgi:sec-independent protein translocase protein TatB|uniref:Sec-independent protein translocase protein TatB n=1 Tax=Congregibacter sp. TaxID=2744308 RepID=UPI0039E2B9C7